MNPASLIEHLHAALAGPLPGWRAEVSGFPAFSYGRHAGPPSLSARQAAVLALLYPQGDQWYLPLTLRPTTLLDHPGQISLPGGSVESDELVEHGAVRELEEELGVDRGAVLVVGRMTPLFVYASNYWVTPCIGVCDQPPEFVPNASEVAEVIRLPVAALRDLGRHGRHEIRRGAVRFDVPHFDYQSHRIWGATLMILSELASLLTGPEPADADDRRADP